MGKIRRQRTKRHIEAVKVVTKPSDFNPNESELPAVFPVNNLFKISQDKTVEITEKTETKQHETPDTTEVYTNKKGKRQARHEKFLRKLHASFLKDEKDKAKKQRGKTAITGDLEPLTQALLDISQMPANKKEKKRKNKRKPASSQQRRLNAQMSDIERFHQVLNHPSFQSSPLQTIDEHVKNVIKVQTNVDN